MIFYESFYDACKDLPEQERLKTFDAIISYGCAGIIPEELTGTPKAIFTLAKPLLDANAERKANGAKGGRPRKDGNPIRRSSKCINFTPSDTDWNEAADLIIAAQK